MIKLFYHCVLVIIYGTLHYLGIKIPLTNGLEIIANITKMQEMLSFSGENYFINTC